MFGQYCEICALEGAVINLAGNFPAVLCIKHRREFHDFVADMPEFLEYQRTIVIARNMIGALGSGDGSIGLEDALLAEIDSEKSVRVMYKVAKEWLSDNAPKQGEKSES